MTANLNTDQWLVVRVAGVRTVIVILNQKNLNLMEVSEEVARLDKSSFGRICMLCLFNLSHLYNISDEYGVKQNCFSF